jgi:hypothetical protein
MLEITPDQMAAMQQDSEGRFRQRVFALLCEQFPEHADDRGAVAAVVDLGIADAREAGLRSERGLAAYVIAAFLLGLDLKDDPYFVTYVRQSGESEAAKIAWIEGYVKAVAEALEQ